MAWQSLQVLAFLSAAFAAAGCGRLGFDAVAADDDVGDPDSANGEPDAGMEACSSFGPFGTPERVFAAESIDDGPSLSADGLTLYLGRYTDGGPFSDDRELWMATRADLASPFGDPVRLDSLNTTGSLNAEPAISTDGLTIYFQSNRDGEHRIWRATRDDVGDPFSAPERLAATTSPLHDSRGPSVTADGLELYFHSREGTEVKLWRVTRSAPDLDFGAPTELVELADELLWGYPGISPDGLELFHIHRDGLDRILVARRPDRSSPFSTPELVAELESDANDWDPSPSADDLSIAFTSSRAGSDYDIWMASRECLP